MMSRGAGRSDLLDRLARLDKLIDGHNATLTLLEIERLRVRSELAAAGYQPPAPEARK